MGLEPLPIGETTLARVIVQVPSPVVCMCGNRYADVQVPSDLRSRDADHIPILQVPSLGIRYAEHHMIHNTHTVQAPSLGIRRADHIPIIQVPSLGTRYAEPYTLSSDASNIIQVPSDRSRYADPIHIVQVPSDRSRDADHIPIFQVPSLGIRYAEHHMTHNTHTVQAPSLGIRRADYIPIV